jgi:hypothetical protein
MKKITLSEIVERIPITGELPSDLFYFDEQDDDVTNPAGRYKLRENIRIMTIIVIPMYHLR